jgi:YHS domain-containing protein
MSRELALPLRFVWFSQKGLLPRSLAVRAAGRNTREGRFQYLHIEEILRMRKLFSLVFLLVAAVALPVFGQEKVPPVDASKGIAIKGYDAVAYFEQSQAVKGSPSFVYQWNGAKWFFATQAHRDAFAKEPEHYAPQYGGYCAFGMSQGHAVPVDPEAWKIVDGKLYLNYNKDIQKEWFKDIPGHIKEADENWPKLRQ